MEPCLKLHSFINRHLHKRRFLMLHVNLEIKKAKLKAATSNRVRQLFFNVYRSRKKARKTKKIHSMHAKPDVSSRVYETFQKNLFQKCVKHRREKKKVLFSYLHSYFIISSPTVMWDCWGEHQSCSHRSGDGEVRPRIWLRWRMWAQRSTAYASCLPSSARCQHCLCGCKNNLCNCTYLKPVGVNACVCVCPSEHIYYM